MLNTRFKCRVSACAALAFGLAQTVLAQEPVRDSGKPLTPMERAKRDAERVFSVIRMNASAPAPTPPARPASKPGPRPVARAASAAASGARTEPAPAQRDAANLSEERDVKPLDVPAPIAPIAPAPLATAVRTPAPSVAKPTAESRNETPAARTVVVAESSYLSQLHAYLESIKRYPSSREAREKRPAGTVRVWMTVLRTGQLAEAGVEASSGSMILDQEALRAVRSGRYPPFPSDAFAGQATRRFVIGMAYALSGGQ